ncbi:MAG: ring-cleaving dioxygenase [Rhodothermales bacterium]|nr:ring-cleaving dioxygenase [Rhodothermales bacterium]
MTLPGIHHVTAIAGPPQRLVDFYTGVLGLRLVKKTVNFDDPGTYHLYFGDDQGRPGSILTFFPWANAAPGHTGSGMAGATAFAVPPGTLDAWTHRLAAAGHDVDAPFMRMDERVLALRDPDGLPLELIEAESVRGADGHALHGFHGTTLHLAAPEHTARLLTDVFGYAPDGEEDGRLRFRAAGGDRAALVDLVPAEARGRAGAGTVHHVAFRARDDAEQLAWQEAVRSTGLFVTDVKDRNYFRSIYFREPGGVLFEIATDPPGFTADEDLGALGTSLKLPAWLEPRRAQIEAQLPPLHVPTASRPAP